MITYSSEQVKMLLNKKLHNIISDDAVYNIVYRNPLDLINKNRLDIVVKYCYAKAKLSGMGINFYEKLYVEHMLCINGLYESDSQKKIGQEEFLVAFNDLLKSMEINGFDISKPIPVSGKNILDGAHRVAACAALGIDVATIEMDFKGHEFGSMYFKDHFLNDDFLHEIVRNFVELKNNVRFILLWSGFDGKKENLFNICEKYGDIIYYNELSFSDIGKINFVKNVYCSENWLGSVENGFSGAQYKAEKCFGNRSKIAYILIESDVDLVEMKECIRSLYGIGKHSVHINDTYIESLQLSKILLNRNTKNYIDLYVNSNFNNFKNYYAEYKSALKNIPNNGYENFCVDGSAVLAAYGVRDCNDFDYLSIAGGEEIFKKTGNFECNNISHAEFGFDVDRCIFDPTQHFYFDEMKFLSLDIILEKKRRRGSYSDFKDLESCMIFSGKFRDKYKKSLWMRKITSRRYIYSRIKGFVFGVVAELKK